MLVLPFGVGVGLTLDEAATLFDFQNRYWSAKLVPLVEAGLALGVAGVLARRVVNRGSDPA